MWGRGAVGTCVSSPSSPSPPPRPPPGVAHAGGKHLQHELIPPPAAAWLPAAGKWPSASMGGWRGRSWGTVLAPHGGLGPIGGTSLPCIPGWGQWWGCSWMGGGRWGSRGAPGVSLGRRGGKSRELDIKVERCEGERWTGSCEEPPSTQSSLSTQCLCPSPLPAGPPHAVPSPARIFQPRSVCEPLSSRSPQRGLQAALLPAGPAGVLGSPPPGLSHPLRRGQQLAERHRDLHHLGRRLQADGLDGLTEDPEGPAG